MSPGYLRSLVPSAAPEHGEPWPAIQADIARAIQPGLTHWQSPNFMAFYPANSTFPAMLGEMYSAAFTAAAFNWIASPAVTELETIVMDWLAQLLCLPDGFLSKGHGGGILQGTASEVVLTSVVAARERVLRRRFAHLPDGADKEDQMSEARGRLVALGGEHAHSGTQKAAIVAGTRFRAVPSPQSSGFRLTGPALADTIRQCKEQGLEPCYLTITLGTTSTCAVDDFASILAVAREHSDIWLHVDAAYAGAALVCPEYQHYSAQLAGVDSFNVNMHKWLLTNFDASAFFVQQRRDLIDTYSITPPFLRNDFSDSGLVIDYRDWQIPLGRRFRALKVWFVLRSYGAAGLRAHIRAGVALGERFHASLCSRSDLFEVVSGPAFGLTTFAVKPRRAAPDGSEAYRAEANKITKDVCETVNASREIYVTSSVVGGIYVIRVVTGSPNAAERFVCRAFDIFVQVTEKLLARAG